MPILCIQPSFKWFRGEKIFKLKELEQMHYFLGIEIEETTVSLWQGDNLTDFCYR